MRGKNSKIVKKNKIVVPDKDNYQERQTILFVIEKCKIEKILGQGRKCVCCRHKQLEEKNERNIIVKQ